MEVYSVAIVDSSAQIGAGTTVVAGASIEADVQIGRDCQIESCAIFRIQARLCPIDA